MSQQEHAAEDNHADGRLAFEELTHEIIGVTSETAG